MSDDPKIHKARRKPGSSPLGDALLDSPTREYIATLARERPFRIEITTARANLANQLKTQWPQESRTSEQTPDLQRRILNIIKPLVDNMPPRMMVRLVIHVARQPERSAASPDAPAIFATFDAVHGFVHHRAFSSQESSGISGGETVELGLTLLCQPIEVGEDQRRTSLDQSKRRLLFSARELKDAEHQIDERQSKLVQKSRNEKEFNQAYWTDQERLLHTRLNDQERITRERSAKRAQLSVADAAADQRRRAQAKQPRSRHLPPDPNKPTPQPE